MRRHYGQYGSFRSLANQPGVEFHLKLNKKCSLGDVGQWFGWQCKLYDIPKARAIGVRRRQTIIDAIKKTENVLPDITDWILWTRYPLTKSDQEWFDKIETHMKLDAWTYIEVEEHLSGPAEILRGTYFGELVLTNESLLQIREQAVTRIKNKWHPEVHQVVEAERHIRQVLADINDWEEILSSVTCLQSSVDLIQKNYNDSEPEVIDQLKCLCSAAGSYANSLSGIYELLKAGNYEILRQDLSNIKPPDSALSRCVRWLRSARHPSVFDATNLLADISSAYESSQRLLESSSDRLLAVVAEAGCGKTQLAAQLTLGSVDIPAGVLLYGADLQAGQSLDDLARRVVIQGQPTPSFDALIAAVNAAGERASRRIAIVIDGLNESEDPRNWKALIAPLESILSNYDNVCVICTLRGAFVELSLPDETTQLKIPHFEEDTESAVDKYFEYYKIDPSDAELYWGLLQHPLTLRMFCEVTNPERIHTVGVERMPDSLTPLFERYLDQVAERIAELSPRSFRYYASNVRSALSSIGSTLWEENNRSLDVKALRNKLSDDQRSWNDSIVRLLEDEGVLIRGLDRDDNSEREAIVFDLLAGYIIADALLDTYRGKEFEVWLNLTETKAKIFGDYNTRHPLADDIF
ncbi:MAG: ATP-binding protein, partial [Ekhidna sp.]